MVWYVTQRSLDAHLKSLPFLELAGIHVPEFKHFPRISQGFSTLSQKIPKNPGWHSQLKEFFESMHKPSLKQGFEPHSLMSTSQYCPVNPAKHLQSKLSSPSMQIELSRVRLKMVFRLRNLVIFEVFGAGSKILNAL